MKKTVFLFAILFSFSLLKAQDLNKIDAIVGQYPKSFDSSEELATMINKDFETDVDKARAIYSWITTSVKFDVDTQFSKKKKKRLKYKDKVDRAQKLQKRRIQMEKKALTQHLAVAEGYATLYKRVCELCGIYGYIVKGTGKLRTFDIGKLPRMQNHSWNVVQIDKEWFFVDAAMGAGTVDFTEKTYEVDFNDKFFFTPPEVFFLNHFPKEKGWLKVEKTDEDFSKLPLFYGEYLKHDLELQEPLIGDMNLQGIDSIKFEINAPQALDNLSYQFNYEKEPNEITIEQDKDTSTFYIPFTVKRRGYFTVFYNKKAILSYKVSGY